ncbi:hypothetical protein TrRE_jg3703, partial [Triparma retinervis]
MSRISTLLLIPRLLPRSRLPPLLSSPLRPYSNITYSGGHASEGQGGFYGSGGARALQSEQTQQREGAVAHAEDVRELGRVVGEIEE